MNSFQQPDLFAGKVHGLLERDYKTRVKGRDHYDFVWFIARKTPVHLEHLHEKLKQSSKWSIKNGWNFDTMLTPKTLHALLKQKFSSIDFELAKKDVAPFIKDQDAIRIWSSDFFSELVERINCV